MKSTTPWMMAAFFLLYAPVLFVLSVGCEPVDFGTGNTCAMDEGTVVVSGSWVISGDGERYSCNDSAFEGDFGLGPSSPLSISQTGDMETLKLRSVPSGFAMEGSVTGSCVDFTTEEDWNGQVIIRRFTGTLTPNGNISGTFTGNGPYSCQTNGTFMVEID